MSNSIKNITDYIPQREPMIMVDKLINYSKDITISEFTVHPSNIFIHEGFFSEAGLLENMAQTAALSKGYEFNLKNEKPPIGFIGAVKNFQIIQLPAIHETIITTIAIKHQVMNASIVDANIKLDDQIIASCELKIFLNPNIE